MKSKQVLKWMGISWVVTTLALTATPFAIIWTSDFTGVYASGFRVPVFPLGKLNVIDACEGQGIVNLESDLFGQHRVYDNHTYGSDGWVRTCFKPATVHLGDHWKLQDKAYRDHINKLHEETFGETL